MKVVKWLDEHFEEAIILFFLAVIACVTLLQIFARNVPIFQSLSWAEELCRYAWIATVFLSLPYTIRTETILRVTALVDVMPWKVRNIINVIVDVITFSMLAILAYNAVIVLQRIFVSGETSPAMEIPMWIMYLIVLIGFVLGALRSVQMFVKHIKTINVEPKSTIEEQTEFELESGNFDTEAIKSMGKEGDA